jgi:hypothetical protein
MSEQINASGLIGESQSKPMEVQVTVHGENAVLHFSAPREYVAFTGPEALLVGARLMVAAIEAQPHAGNSAIQAAMAIIDAVYEMRGDLKPAGGAVKHELIERHRRTLTNRLNTVLTSTREKKTTTNEKLAKQLVDIMLHEVFA